MAGEANCTNEGPAALAPTQVFVISGPIRRSVRAHSATAFMVLFDLFSIHIWRPCSSRAALVHSFEISHPLLLQLLYMRLDSVNRTVQQRGRGLHTVIMSRLLKSPALFTFSQPAAFFLRFEFTQNKTQSGGRPALSFFLITCFSETKEKKSFIFPKLYKLEKYINIYKYFLIKNKSLAVLHFISSQNVLTFRAFSSFRAPKRKMIAPQGSSFYKRVFLARH